MGIGCVFVGVLGAPLRKRASFQVEADVTLQAWKVLAAAQVRTKRGGTALPTRGKHRVCMPNLSSFLL